MSGVTRMGEEVDWSEFTSGTLAELEAADERYRPTNFWGPGLTALLNDLDQRGLDTFKSWPTAGFWFYPKYGNGFSEERIAELYDEMRPQISGLRQAWLRRSLNGAREARRDFDALRLAWDRERWPYPIAEYGESQVGEPTQYYPMIRGRKVGWTRPYLNYLLCLSALSQHVHAPPRSFLELGGGFGVLGEIVLRRDPEARYVDLDIPPLLTVASYYLSTLFEDRIQLYDDSLPRSGPIDLTGSAVLPNWRLPDVRGQFDVFVNTFSFQEMEPDVVDNYIAQVADKDVEYVVSLNSKRGKPKLSDGHAIGVSEPVTSAMIVAGFAGRGYRLLRAYNSPMVHSAGELVVMRRESRPTGSSRPGARGRLADDWVPPRVLRGVRNRRAR